MIEKDKFSIWCTGDVCVGDKILFSEAVFGGSFRKTKFLGDREVAAEIIKDSYGFEKQQHTFTIKIIASEGFDELIEGVTVRRKGRNIYRNGTWRALWADESSRQAALDEKHRRGEEAGLLRSKRIEKYN